MLTPTDHPAIAPEMLDALARSGLVPLRVGGRALLPIVQGGMGVGISAHRLAGAVARLGGVGTLSSVDLRRHHADLMEATGPLESRVGFEAEAKAQIDAANLEALAREVRAAREAAQGFGLIAMNVMRAVGDYAAYVRTSLESGVDMVVVGAGLPLDLPEMAADLNDPRFEFERAIPESLDFLRKAGLEGRIPLIPAGGIRRCEEIAALQALGAAAVQLGTPFVATHECDAHEAFKHVLADARDEDIVEFVSVAGLPARAVLTPWLKAYLKHEAKLKAAVHGPRRCQNAFDCLAQCGLRDGMKDWGQFCIDTRLALALQGDVRKGLFFRGAGPMPFGHQIRSVRELVERLLTPGFAVPQPITA